MMVDIFLSLFLYPSLGLEKLSWDKVNSGLSGLSGDSHGLCPCRIAAPARPRPLLSFRLFTQEVYRICLVGVRQLFCA